MRKLRFILVFALCFAAAATTIAWFLLSPESPFETSPSVKQIGQMIHFPAVVLGILIGGGGICGPRGSEGLFWGLIFAQWLVPGIGLASLMTLLRNNSGATR
jgi:hypothetical protein